MPRAVTDSDVLTQPPTPRRAADSPPPCTPVRARVATTQRNPTQRKRRLGPAVRKAAASWWVWTARPPSLRATWRLSAVTKSRVPLESGPLSLVWRISNWTDRLVMFVLILIAPTFLAGPVRWLAARPTRRFALYLFAGVAAAVLLLG
jgi:hypothetical protein